MSIRGRMIHSCLIERATTTRDEFGELTADWANASTVYSGICRFHERQETMPLPEETLQIVTTYKLLLPGEIDVEPGDDEQAEGSTDRVTTITLEDGSQVGPFEILEVNKRRGSRSVELTALDLEEIS